MPAPGCALSFGLRAALSAYGIAWRIALPGLKRSSRLAEGWAERMLEAGPLPQADLWVQAASGGEAYLAWELLRRLPDQLPGERLRVLATTFTSQGLGILRQGAEELTGSLELTPAYFPFDLPGRMRAALAQVRPRAVVLLEAELWPGLLAACREQDVPALVVNGRMTEKSRRGYCRLPWFWRSLAPELALAISEQDAERFDAVFGPGRTEVMHNIKFDRLRFDARPAPPEFAGLLPQSAPLVVLGSVRKEEEAQVLSLIQGLRERLPGAVIGLFPRHMQRVAVWEKTLTGSGVPFALRSASQAAEPGSVLLWDQFGELSGAFSLASCAFIGGSLADLGGQNFLEPLAHGVAAVTGPSWSNFAWVGPEVFDTGLVRRAEDWRGVLDALCALAENPPERGLVRAAAAAYAASRRGGAEAACQRVAERLGSA